MATFDGFEATPPASPVGIPLKTLYKFVNNCVRMITIYYGKGKVYCV